MKTMTKTLIRLKYLAYQIMASINVQEQDLMILSYFLSYWV